MIERETIGNKKRTYETIHDSPEATKYDNNKLRYDLIPSTPLEELAKVYTIGSIKYGDNNWRKGMMWSRIIGSMLRHLYAWIKGETYDKEDGQHHLAAVAWAAFTLIQYEKDNIGKDDRQQP